MKPVDSGGLGTSTDTAGPRPVIVVVDDESSSIRSIGDELQRRYGHDYRIVTVRSPRRALANVEHMREAGDRVAVVLAAQRMAEMSGAQLCERVHELHPHAKRALLIAWADWADETTAHAVRRAIALGHAESYVLKPWRRPDELFHRAISEFLQEWSGGDYSVPREVAVVAERRSSRGHELRTLLSRNGVPHVFHASDSAEGSRLLRATGRELTTEPVVVLLDGRAFVDPSNADVARAFGVTTELTDRREFDVVVVGAGPAGLAAGVYASSEGLRTLVVEREAAGGQARDGRVLPAPRHPYTRTTHRCRCLLRVLSLRVPAFHGRARVRRRRGKFGGPGRRAPEQICSARDDGRAGPFPRREHVTLSAR